jgi:hypothetical protein
MTPASDDNLQERQEAVDQAGQELREAIDQFGDAVALAAGSSTSFSCPEDSASSRSLGPEGGPERVA